MIKRAGRSAANDPGIAALLEADADAITYVAKTWDYQVHVALGSTLEENLEGIAQSIEAARAKARGDLIASISSTATRQPDLCVAMRKDGLRCRRALDRAVRHQRRDAAA